MALYSVTYAVQPYMMTTKGLNTEMCDVNVNFLIRLAVIILFCSICSKITNMLANSFSGFKLFVGNLNSNKDYDELKEAMTKFFAKGGLEIQDVRLGGSK